eukprot:CAMPEP_0181477950 /NCGR_PEP_ID=MMETSP1110-20121109/42486_1 /TAXON_ID=174948 /ORGANISM="Symbiodinium sp., Strain CCMP421" /LENGTH=359 /DNA_ID=CAMNT_0023603279 /DNA_START=115 /DNA_END=1194 /DNA_ORIENTATION=+
MASASPSKQLLQLLQQQPGPSTLAEVAGALGSLALEAKDDDGTIVKIRALIESLQTAVKAQHNEAAQALTNTSTYEACSSAKDQAFVQASSLTTTTAPPTTTSTGAPTTTTIHADLATCKAEEAELIRKNQTCHNELAASFSAKQATCELYEEFNFADAGAARGARCADKATFSGTYEEYLERDILTLSTLKARGKNCTDTSAVYGLKSTECSAVAKALSDKLQECLELEVHLAASNALPEPAPSQAAPVQVNCGPWAAKVAACSNYDTCYTTKVAMQESAYTSAQQLATSRQAESTALQRIACLLDVLEAGTADQSDKLAACLAAAHDISGLALVKPTAPAKATCEPGVQPAGCTAAR